MKNYIRKNILNLPSINWGTVDYDDSYTILKWGESSIQIPQAIKDDIFKSLNDLNRYPYLKEELLDELCKYCKISKKQITLTNGLDKAFRLISEVFLNKGDQAITFYPTYPAFESCVKLMDSILISIPLDKNFKISEITKIKEKITNKTKLIYICNPNNPTANYIASYMQIEKILALNVILIVDEAYFEFSGKSCAKLLEKYPNLIILRSFSKTFGLAGIRVGYILASEKISCYLQKVEDTLEVFNISSPSLAGGISALKNLDLIKKNIKLFNKQRNKYSLLLKKYGIKVYKSSASFLLFNVRILGMTAKEFLDEMFKLKIILKDISIYKGLSEYDVYSAIPNAGQIKLFEDALSKILIKSKCKI